MSVASRNLAVVARLSTLALLVAPLMPAAAQPGAPAIAPLFQAPWGASADSIQSRATDFGWEFLKVDEDGDYAFRAVIDGEEAMVFATFGKTGLTRLLVSVAPHAAALVTYEQIADTISSHFGRAALSTSNAGPELQPAPSMLQATAWPGVLMGLRRDGRIILVLTCPEHSPRLPSRRLAAIT